MQPVSLKPTTTLAFLKSPAKISFSRSVRKSQPSFNNHLQYLRLGVPRGAKIAGPAMSSPQEEMPQFGLNGDYDEEDALAAAIAMSLEQPNQSPPPPQSATTNATEEQATPASLPTEPNSFGSLALDRRKMEAERLARQRKRSAVEAGLETSPSRHRPTPPALSASRLSHASAVAGTTRTSSLPFSKGAVKRTWALGQPQTEQDIKIEDILMRNELELAVISSFQWDDTWLLSKIDISRTKLILVAFANDEAHVRICRVFSILRHWHRSQLTCQSNGRWKQTSRAVRSGFASPQ